MFGLEEQIVRQIENWLHDQPQRVLIRGRKFSWSQCLAVYSKSESTKRSPAPGEEQPHVPVYSGGHPDGKQLGREEPGHLMVTKLNITQ